MGSGVVDRASSAAARFRVASSPAGPSGRKTTTRRTPAGRGGVSVGSTTGRAPPFAIIPLSPSAASEQGDRIATSGCPPPGGGRLFVNKSHSDNRLHVTRGHLPAGARVVGG